MAFGGHFLVLCTAGSLDLPGALPPGPPPGLCPWSTRGLIAAPTQPAAPGNEIRSLNIVLSVGYHCHPCPHNKFGPPLEIPLKRPAVKWRSYQSLFSSHAMPVSWCVTCPVLSRIVRHEYEHWNWLYAVKSSKNSRLNTNLSGTFIYAFTGEMADILTNLKYLLTLKLLQMKWWKDFWLIYSC